MMEDWAPHWLGESSLENSVLQRKIFYEIKLCKYTYSMQLSKRPDNFCHLTRLFIGVLKNICQRFCKTHKDIPVAAPILRNMESLQAEDLLKQTLGIFLATTTLLRAPLILHQIDQGTFSLTVFVYSLFQKYGVHIFSNESSCMYIIVISPKTI